MEFDPQKWDKSQIARGAYFLQSSSWGNFQRSLGNVPHYLSGDGWSCLLMERKTPLGAYLFAPYGPTLEAAKDLLDALRVIKAHARKKGFDWLIIEPIGPTAETLKAALPKLGARPSSHGREPDRTRIIDLKPPADDLLASISQSTRSLIRKNQRQQFLSFQTSDEPKDIAIFIDMLMTVTRRNNVYFFPDEYFHKQAKLLMPSGMLRLELALRDGQPIASALFHDFGQMSAYTFGASLPEARSTGAAALLLYQAMLNAKNRGMKSMDLFGIAPEGAPASHPWSGFSSFKQKFGGQVVDYAGAWDIALSARYRLYRAAQAVRRRHH